MQENDYEIVNIMRNEEGVVVAELMDDEMKKDVLTCEMKRLKEIVPFINKGLEEAFREEEALVLIKRNKKVEEDNNFKYSGDYTFTLRTDGGRIIGEMVFDEEELEELRKDPNVYFLSDNFVTYSDMTTPGQKQYFVVEGEKSKFVTDKDIDSTVKSLVVGIPSTETDHYIKDYYDLSGDEALGTIIIGFTPLDS